MSGKIGPDINENGLILHLDAANRNSYPGSGTTWTDLSGNGNNGTLTNGPTFNAANMGSIVFDGTNDYIYRSSISNFNSSTYTILLWGKFVSVSSSGILFNLGRSSGDADTEAQLYYNNSRLVYWDYAGSIAFNFIQSSGTLSTNVYQYLGFTKNSTNGTFYINGYSSGTGTAAFDANISTNDFTIGADIRDSINYVNGNISQFLLYNRVLTASEVLQNYNATKSRFGR
jgi:hypothetical protein